jgi:hypothetical protein
MKNMSCGIFHGGEDYIQVKIFKDKRIVFHVGNVVED